MNAMEGPPDPTRRTFLKGVAGGVAAGASLGMSNTSEAALRGIDITKQEKIHVPEHPAAKIMHTFAIALNRFFVEKPDLSPDQISEADRAVLDPAIETFLEEHGVAMGLIQGQPRPLQIDIWSLTKALSYSFNTKSDPRACYFLESIADRKAFGPGNPPAGLMPTWNGKT